MIRVLYVNHTATISGGEMSLLTALRALPRDRVAATVACPPGALANAVATLGVPWRSLRGTAGSLRLHPVDTPRAVLELVADAARVRALAHRGRSDLVHANSIRAGLVAVAARGLGGPPVVVSVRDVLPDGAASRATLRVLEHGAAARLANSRYTLAHAGARKGATVLHPPVDLAALGGAREHRASARAALGLAEDEPVMATVGQITPWKGHDDAIRVLGHLRDAGLRAHLLIVGSPKFAAATTRFDNHRHLAELHELTAARGLEDRVHFLGERDDVPQLLSAVDLLLLPSWNEPFGRVVLEAMALGVPVLATDQGGPAELLADDAGVLLPPRLPELWARAAADLLADPGHRRSLGERAHARAVSQFGLEAHVQRLLAIYAGVLPKSATSLATLEPTS